MLQTVVLVIHASLSVSPLDQPTFFRMTEKAGCHAAYIGAELGAARGVGEFGGEAAGGLETQLFDLKRRPTIAAVGETIVTVEWGSEEDPDAVAKIAKERQQGWQRIKNFGLDSTALTALVAKRSGTARATFALGKKRVLDARVAGGEVTAVASDPGGSLKPRTLRFPSNGERVVAAYWHAGSNSVVLITEEIEEGVSSQRLTAIRLGE